MSPIERRLTELNEQYQRERNQDRLSLVVFVFCVMIVVGIAMMLVVDMVGLNR